MSMMNPPQGRDMSTAPIESLVGEVLGAPAGVGNRSDWSFLSESSLSAVRSRTGRQRALIALVCAAVVAGLVGVLLSSFRPRPTTAQAELDPASSGALVPVGNALPRIGDALPELLGMLAVPLVLWMLALGLVWWLASRYRRQRVCRPIGRFARAALAIVSVLMVVIGAFVTAFDVYFIPSASMSPTLQVQDRIFVDPRDTDVEVGDVIVYDSAGFYASDVLPAASVKRVIAMAGDRVEGRGGELLVNGVPSPWLLDLIVPLSDFAPVEIGPGELFAMGDNHRGSSDSRVFGPIPQTLVTGTVRAVWTPGGP